MFGAVKILASLFRYYSSPSLSSPSFFLSPEADFSQFKKGYLWSMNSKDIILIDFEQVIDSFSLPFSPSRGEYHDGKIYFFTKNEMYMYNEPLTKRGGPIYHISLNSISGAISNSFGYFMYVLHSSFFCIFLFFLSFYYYYFITFITLLIYNRDIEDCNIIITKMALQLDYNQTYTFNQSDCFDSSATTVKTIISGSQLYLSSIFNY